MKSLAFEHLGINPTIGKMAAPATKPPMKAAARFAGKGKKPASPAAKFKNK